MLELLLMCKEMSGNECTKRHIRSCSRCLEQQSDEFEKSKLLVTRHYKIMTAFLTSRNKSWTAAAILETGSDSSLNKSILYLSAQIGWVKLISASKGAALKVTLHAKKSSI